MCLHNLSNDMEGLKNAPCRQIELLERIASESKADLEHAILAGEENIQQQLQANQSAVEALRVTFQGDLQVLGEQITQKAQE